MKNILSSIKFLSLLCTITLAVTYVISLFDNWFRLKWLPNSLLLALSSGIFASSLVVWLTEVKKYSDTKKCAEDSIYGYCGICM